MASYLLTKGNSVYEFLLREQFVAMVCIVTCSIFLRIVFATFTKKLITKWLLILTNQWFWL